MKTATVTGAGLVGTLLSVYLAQRGYAITLYESRSDPRQRRMDNGRSINLAMSCRGLTALREANLSQSIGKLMTPMRARAIHEESGVINYQPFGRCFEECIHAVQRNELNNMLLDEAESLPNIRIYFNANLQKLDVNKKTLQGDTLGGGPFTHKYQRLIGADGAGSFVRDTLLRDRHIGSQRLYLPYGYKELSISGQSPEHLAREHLHLWPRNSFMLLGNPNRNHSITGSLFLAHQGKNSFAELDNALKIHDFFRTFFPDVYADMPDLIGEFTKHPTGNMSTIYCSPWYYKDQCLLIGDAAHGVVPFFGQGMNSGFEDCRILNTLLDRFDDDWSRVMPAFYQARKHNTDAVAQMSLDNYHEIQTDISDPQFNLKKCLQQELMQRYPEYQSKHVLVMFTNTPYAQALAAGVLQQKLLNTVSSDINDLAAVDWRQVDILMRQYDKKLTESAILTQKRH